MCTLCDSNTMSTDGLQCVACGVGQQPNQDSTGCVQCTGNTFSTSGVCALCIGQATADHVSCLDCPLNQVAEPPELGCRCANGFYNSSSSTKNPKAGGELLCYSRTEQFNTRYSDRDDRESTAILSEDLTCQPCPSECVDCLYDGYIGQPLLKAGYATAEGADWFKTGMRVVFECPVRMHCPRGCSF
jgi:hypothetical protein